MHPLFVAMGAALGVAIVLWIVLTTPPATFPLVARRTLGFALIAAGVGLMFLRQFAFALLLLFVGSGLVLRWDAGAGKASPGRTSQVRSANLEMTLDHDTGNMDGVILTGDLAGRLLSDCDLPELLQLRSAFYADDESIKLLETYLDFAHSNWRDDASEDAGQATNSPPGSGGISKNEAYRILGLELGASEKDIKEAYHRLIKRVHPDRGGTAALAAKINEARDRLL